MKKYIKPLIDLTFVVGYPFLIIMIVGWFLMPHLKGYLKEVLAFAFLTLIFLSTILLISNLKIRKLLIMFSTSALAMLAVIKLSFYANYGVKISPSALFVIFETNAPEASDFLFQYVTFKVLLIILILMLPLLVIAKKMYFHKMSTINNLRFWSFYFKEHILRILCIMTMFGAFFCIQWKLKEENLFINSSSSFSEYKKTKASLKKDLAQPFSNYVKKVSSKDEAQTYVVIIGESTSNWHMQLYGYDRETNPLLTEIKDELLVFDSVITPDVHTISALDKILTQSDGETPYKKKNTSMVQLANAAGFSTYWISNQRPVGIYESIPTLIGSAANHRYFLNSDNSDYDIYDEVLLPALKEVLSSNVNDKKMIFMHLIGTHGDYKRRYPKKFNYFEDQVNGKKLDSKELAIANHYDNAVRYNDFIVRSIIESVRETNGNSYVVYFSDHGDEVYDTMQWVGHDKYRKTPPMYEIPFLVWVSEKYKDENNFSKEFVHFTGRKYNLEDFIHSFSNLSQIDYEGYDDERSIFSTNFKLKP